MEFLGYRPHHAEPGPSTIPSDLPMTERHFVDDMFRCYRRVRILDSHEDEDSTRDRRFHHKHEIAAQEEDSTSSTPSLDRGLTPEQLQPVTLAKATPPEIRQSRELRALVCPFQSPKFYEKNLLMTNAAFWLSEAFHSQQSTHASTHTNKQPIQPIFNYS